MIETTSATYDVGGVLLERPFKVRRLGHFGLDAIKMEECLAFYTEDLGYRISDRLDFSKRNGNLPRRPAAAAGENLFARRLQ